MNVELFIHGVPQGQQFWGKKDDREYFNIFYNTQQSNEETKFLIELRSVKNKNYCYYSYLKYKNVVASDGRPGAYFGLTLCFDQYYADTLRIYQLLDIIYNKYIVGCLLIEETSRIKFIISNFDSKSKEIGEIYKTVMDLILKIFKESDFQNINSLIVIPSVSTPLLSLYDCTKDNVRKAIEKSYKVLISRDYPSFKEEKESQEIKHKLKLLIDNKEKEIEAINKTLNEENEKTYKLSAENDNLKQEINKLNKLCKENEKRKTVEELIREIKEPLRNLQEPLKKLSVFTNVNITNCTKTNSKETVHPKQSSNIPFYNIIMFVVIILNIIVLGYFTITQSFKPKPQPDINQFENPLTTNKNENTNFVIDIKEYNGNGKLEINKDYTVTLKPTTAGITWELSNVEKKKSSNDTLKITIPESNKEIEIKCIKNDTVLCTRKLKS